MIHCHCVRCRKAHGTSLVSWTHFQHAAFEWLKRGELRHYHSSAAVRRSFCRTCGATVPDPDPTGDQFGFPVGNVLEMTKPDPVLHCYAASKAPWTTIGDEETRFDVVPDHFRDPEMPELERPTGKNALSGSCLCGAVAFEAGAPLFMSHCHCTRCRLARAAPYATNLFVERQTLEWRSGRALINHYKLPGAERFAVGFCSRCGGKVPRSNSTSEVGGIPAGCLDSTPDIAPRGHIFVGSKANWFDIADSLPQWDADPPRS